MNFMTCGAALNTAPAIDAPWHIDAIFITVSKISYIFHEVPNHLRAITQPHTHTHTSRTQI